jgi:CHAT domain
MTTSADANRASSGAGERPTTPEFAVDLAKANTVFNADAANKGTPDAVRQTVQNDVTLRIQAVPQQDGEYEFGLCGRLISDPSYLSGITKKTHADLFGAANECRQAWSTHVVDRLDPAKNSRPFQEQVDFSTRPELLDGVGRELAVAGSKLFSATFEDEADDGLKSLASKVRELLQCPRYLAVSSDKVFMPWSLMYTHPVSGEKLKKNGANWDKRGFWGYSHIIQQSPNQFRFESRLLPEADGAMRLSVNFDDRLPVTLELDSILKHIQAFESLGGKNAVTMRTKREQLGEAFSDQRDVLERLIYFFCHGHGGTSNGVPALEEPYFQLSDNGKISSGDFRYWATDDIHKIVKPLPTAPLMFFNACQGGQMNTLFYKGFARELLSQGASGLIGAQIDVPAVFAVEYANALFTELFNRKDSQRLGPLMRHLNQTFWDKQSNPLGLVFSLYRGVDCYVDWSATRRDASEIVLP